MRRFRNKPSLYAQKKRLLEWDKKNNFEKEYIVAFLGSAL